MNLAIIVAGGQGLRMKSDVRKQYLELSGIPVLARTLNAFNDSPDISRILLVVPQEDFDFVTKNILPCIKPAKEIRLVPGGKERQDSVYNGLREIRDEPSIVAIHDGVRPFITNHDISMCIEAAGKFGAGILGVPAMDTLKQVTDDSFIVKTIARETIWLAQTPQAFQFRLIKAAHEAAKQNGIQGTDDASLVEAMGESVKMVPGNKYNIKITTPEDLKFAEAILKLAAEPV